MTTYARSEVSRDGESGGETPSMAGLLHINFLAVVIVVVVVLFFVVVVVFVIVDVVADVSFLSLLFLFLMVLLPLLSFLLLLKSICFSTLLLNPKPCRYI